MTLPVFVRKVSLATRLGDTFEDHLPILFGGEPGPHFRSSELVTGETVPYGALRSDPPPLQTADGSWESRNNRLLNRLLEPLVDEIALLRDRHGPHRIGVVVGTTTSGIASNEAAYAAHARDGVWPAAFRYSRQELGDPARFLAHRIHAEGPCYVVSTACSSGAKAIVSAARLLQARVCDLVLCGAADTYSSLALNGFAALEAISKTICNPFSRNRDGITIGEGGSLLLLQREPSSIRIAGWGENCDAYHFSAPDPDGTGAELALRTALANAELTPRDIGYVNLHGTGTQHNDAMEAGVVSRIFGQEVPCSSTKGLTGHTLGAAGACEAALTMAALLHRGLPIHAWDGEWDEDLPELQLVRHPLRTSDARFMVSCSYAFGGNNCALVLARE